MWCENYRKAKEWREREAQSGRVERVVCSVYDVRDMVKERVEKNKKGEIFCLPCRTGNKMSWWNWGGEVERTVPRAQNGRTGITDLSKVAGTVNQNDEMPTTVWKSSENKGEERNERRQEENC